VEDLKKAKIALVTDGGLVPEGNPDKLEWMAATKYVTIDVSRRDSLPGGEFYANHTGYDTTAVNENPLRLVPLDALRELEEQGIIKELNSRVYSTTGVTTTVEYSQRIGRGIAERLKQDGVAAVILTST
jgi:glycine/betaine/sarcosine/D-proline reductase family selenoprotein B